MQKRTVLQTRFLLFVCLLLTATPLLAQRERQVPAPQNSESASKFFSQLKSIFGRFRDAELERAFQLADPIQCTELLSGKGEWRPVAFFNENRDLGGWYRSSIAEVRADLTVYIFKGTCKGERGTIDLTTKYPVGESLDAFDAGRIPFDQIDVNVNAPVRLSFDSRTGGYAFDLPYLYLVKRQGNRSTYSLVPPRFGDQYATEVTNAWECKAVTSDDITYRFLICQTSTQDRRPQARNQRSSQDFGSKAYFILSDGSEAHSTVTLNFGGSDEEVPAAPADAARDTVEDTGVAGWQAPILRSQLMDLEKTEFRVRFNAQVWKDRIGSSQVLSDQRIASLQTARSSDGADYCVWSPGAANMSSRLLSDEPDKDVAYSVSGLDRGTAQSTSSISIVMKTLTGTRLGTLQCFFSRIDKAGSVDYDRWTAIVGGQLKLEVRPGQ
jgi:hypothetical protein